MSNTHLDSSTWTTDRATCYTPYFRTTSFARGRGSKRACARSSRIWDGHSPSSSQNHGEGLRLREVMKLNEKNVASFATCSSPIDKEGYLEKRGDNNRGYQRRWFVLKGNLLFYFEKKQDKEPLGLIVLEACSVQVSSQAKYAFEISFDGQGSRVYIMTADNDEDMQSWIKVISHASYEYMRSIVDELQRRVNVLTSSSKADQEAAASDMSLLHVGPAKRVAKPRTTTQTTAGSRTEKSSPGSGKVENGILVDLSEDQPSPPPIPKKTKSHTTKPSLSGVAEHSSLESSPAPPSPQKRQAVQVTSGAYSSPYALPSRLNPDRPLSPPSTMDRTEILQPLPNILPATDSEFCTLPPPPPSSANNPSSTAKPLVELLGKTQSTVSPSTARPKQLAAGPLADTSKTVFELHKDFTQALSALHNSKHSS